MIAAIYARLSDDKRKGTEQEGLNVDEQIEACKDFIKSKGWKLGKVYRDDSISATSGVVRPGFEQMLSDAPPVVVYWKQSRLERSPRDLDRFLMEGCEGYGTDGTRATMENASGELVSHLLSLVGRFEQRNKAEFQKQANLRLAKLGKYRGSIRPFGQERDGSWVPGEAEAVREAAKDIVEGRASFHAIARRWNDAQLLTPQTGKQGGREWTSGTVRNYYTRPRLYGMQDYEGTLYPLKDWQPLLTQETFEQLQAIINGKRTGKRGVSYGRADSHLLTGIVKCAECGRGMNVAYRGAKGSPKIYKCPTAAHQSVTAGPLEYYVSHRAIGLLRHHEDTQAEAEEASGRLAELVAEKAAAESANREWIEEAAEAGLKPSVIAARVRAHEARIADIDAEVFRLRKDMQTSIWALTGPRWPDVGAYLLTGWQSVSLEQQRDLLQGLFTAVHVTRGAQGARFDPDRISYDLTELVSRGVSL